MSACSTMSEQRPTGYLMSAQREAEPYPKSNKANADRTAFREEAFQRLAPKLIRKTLLGSRTALCEGSPGALDPISFPTLNAASSTVVIHQKLFAL